MYTPLPDCTSKTAVSASVRSTKMKRSTRAGRGSSTGGPALARHIVGALAGDLNRRVCRRDLHNVACEGRQRRVDLRVGRARVGGGVVWPSASSVSRASPRRRGEAIQLGAVHHIGHRLGRMAERHRQRTRFASGSKVPPCPAFCASNPRRDAVHHIGAGHARLACRQPATRRAGGHACVALKVLKVGPALPVAIRGEDGSGQVARNLRRPQQAVHVHGIIQRGVRLERDLRRHAQPHSCASCIRKYDAARFSAGSSASMSLRPNRATKAVAFFRSGLIRTSVTVILASVRSGSRTRRGRTASTARGGFPPTCAVAAESVPWRPAYYLPCRAACSRPCAWSRPA